MIKDNHRVLTLVQNQKQFEMRNRLVDTMWDSVAEATFVSDEASNGELSFE